MSQTQSNRSLRSPKAKCPLCVSCKSSLVPHKILVDFLASQHLDRNGTDFSQVLGLSRVLRFAIFKSGNEMVVHTRGWTPAAAWLPVHIDCTRGLSTAFTDDGLRASELSSAVLDHEQDPTDRSLMARHSIFSNYDRPDCTKALPQRGFVKSR